MPLHFSITTPLRNNFLLFYDHGTIIQTGITSMNISLNKSVEFGMALK